MNNPLKALIGIWKGDKGIDLAPKPDVDETNPYYEVLEIRPVDIEIENAEEQELNAVMYHQVVREKANDKVSHDETGYWIWDKNNNKIMCAFSIPRGVTVLAGGNFQNSDDNEIEFKVDAQFGSKEWSISQSPFMNNKAKTTKFSRVFIVNTNTLTYNQETTVEIYDKTFAHKDSNSLIRVQ